MRARRTPCCCSTRGSRRPPDPADAMAELNLHDGDPIVADWVRAALASRAAAADYGCFAGADPSATRGSAGCG